MYIAPGQGAYSPWGQVLMSTETSCHFGHLLLVSNHESLPGVLGNRGTKAIFSGEQRPTNKGKQGNTGNFREQGT